MYRKSVIVLPVVLLLYACAPDVGPTSVASGGSVDLRPGLAAQVLALANAARVRAGCAPLSADARLQAAALGHASAMAGQDFFSHTGADGSSVRARVTAQGYRSTLVGENIAAGQETAAETFDGWMASPGHRANLLNCAYAETGIAVVTQPDDRPLPGQDWPMRIYWVQVFGA